ncbi:MAG: helix-hairpin-helix domain-containing protein [candidate division WOR-3 bacterium]
MNAKEKTVVIFLIVSLLIGSCISLWKNYQLKKDYQKLSVSAVYEAKEEAISSETTLPKSNNLTLTDLININTASKSELEQLVGIGPVLAQRIIDYRNEHNGFKTKEEIMKVSGIGVKKFAAIKDKIIIH